MEIELTVLDTSTIEAEWLRELLSNWIADADEIKATSGYVFTLASAAVSCGGLSNIPY